MHTATSASYVDPQQKQTLQALKEGARLDVFSLYRDLQIVGAETVEAAIQQTHRLQGGNDGAVQIDAWIEMIVTLIQVKLPHVVRNFVESMLALDRIRCRCANSYNKQCCPTSYQETHHIMHVIVSIGAQTLSTVVLGG